MLKPVHACQSDRCARVYKVILALAILTASLSVSTVRMWFRELMGRLVNESVLYVGQ